MVQSPYCYISENRWFGWSSFVQSMYIWSLQSPLDGHLFQPACIVVWADMLILVVSGQQIPGFQPKDNIVLPESLGSTLK